LKRFTPSTRLADAFAARVRVTLVAVAKDAPGNPTTAKRALTLKG
jgi:hypothetical protein